MPALRPRLPLLVLTVTGLPALWAQSRPDSVASGAVSAVEVFAAGPALTAGSFSYDNPGAIPDVAFDTYKLPLAHRFGASGASVRPFIEGHLGYFDLDQGNARFDLDVRSTSLTLNPGLEWRLAPWLTVGPRLGLSYARVSERFVDYANDRRQGYDLDVFTLLPSLEVAPVWAHERWDLGLVSRYTVLVSDALNPDARDPVFENESQLWRNEAFLALRPGWELRGLPVRLRFGFARHDLGGTLAEANFVDAFHEVSAGVALATGDRLPLVEQLGITGSWFFGEDFSGWSLGLWLGY